MRWTLLFVLVAGCTKGDRPTPPAVSAPSSELQPQPQPHPLEVEIDETAFATLTRPRSIRGAPLATDANDNVTLYAYDGWLPARRIAGHGLTRAPRELSEDARRVVGELLAKAATYQSGIAKECADLTWVGARFQSDAGGTVEMALSAPCDRIVFEWSTAGPLSRVDAALAKEPANRIRSHIAAAEPVPPRATFLPDSIRGFRAGLSSYEVERHCQKLGASLRDEKWPTGASCVLGKQRYTFEFREDRLVSIFVSDPGRHEHAALTGKRKERHRKLVQALTTLSPTAVSCVNDDGRRCVVDPDAPAVVCFDQRTDFVTVDWRGLVPSPIRTLGELEGRATCAPGVTLVHPSQRALIESLGAQLEEYDDVWREAQRRAATFRAACATASVEELSSLHRDDDVRREQAERACRAYADLASKYPGVMPESQEQSSCPATFDGARAVVDCSTTIATFTPPDEPLWAWANLRESYDLSARVWFGMELDSDRYRH